MIERPGTDVRDVLTSKSANENQSFFTESSFKKQWVGSIEFAASTPGRASSSLIKLAKLRRGHHIHFANAYTVALADLSVDFRELLHGPAVNFPDGKPIGWVSAIKRHSPRLQQIRGPQLFLDVFRDGRVDGIRHYLLGSTPEVLAKLTENLLQQFPGCEIVGVDSPPFRTLTVDETTAQDARIRNSGAHIVWVGLGTPKQDWEVERLSRVLPVAAVAIGAAFDFAAGTLAQAPAWMTRGGLEWVFRLISEPRRLWRRYFFGNFRFIKAALHSRKLPN